MNNHKKIVIISCFAVSIIFVATTFGVLHEKLRAKNLILAVVSRNANSNNQDRTAVLIDLDKNKIAKKLYSSSIGHDLEVIVSPDKKTIAFSKWSDNKMDRNLGIKGIDSSKEKELTSDINGEIDRISWIDNNNILYVFGGHDSAKFGYGDYIYSYNIKTGVKTLIGNAKDQKSDYKYNTVRYLNGQNKIVFSRGAYTEFMQSYGKIYKNSLYLCDKDGSNEKEIASFKDKIIGRVVEIPKTNKIALEAYYYTNEGNEVSDVYTLDLKNNKLELILEHNNKFFEYWNILAYNSDNLLFSEEDKLYNVDIGKKTIKELKVENPNDYNFMSINAY